MNLVAQALLPVRFCEPRVRITHPTTIANPAQERVPVLQDLRSPLVRSQNVLQGKYSLQLA